MELQLRTPGILRFLTTFVVLFWALDLATVAFVHLTGHDYMGGVVPMFRLSEEQNLPTWFSSFLLLVGSVALFVTAAVSRRAGERIAGDWTLLAWAFLFLSADEAASIHEMLVRPFAPMMNREAGLVTSAWVIPYAILGLLLGVRMIRLLRTVSPVLRNRLIIAGCIYVGGAAGMEVLSNEYAKHVAGAPLLWLLNNIEETMEMAGATLLIRAVLLHLQVAAPRLRLVLDPDAPTA